VAPRPWEPRARSSPSVASATAPRELIAPDGTTVPAETLQTASLAGIADLFALVVGKADDISD